MRQDDAVETPVGAEIEEHELAVSPSPGQRRLDVLARVRALVIGALSARGYVRAHRECKERAQREGLHMGLQMIIAAARPPQVVRRGLRRQGFSISASTSLADSASWTST